MTCGARVDVHTAYVAVMRERALDERPDGARQRARETTREDALCYSAATERVRARTFCHV